MKEKLDFAEWSSQGFLFLYSDLQRLVLGSLLKTLQGTADFIGLFLPK